MTTSSDNWIVFTIGRYNHEQTQWQVDATAPTTAMPEPLWRDVLDAAGEDTMDTTGDIDPTVMRALLRRLPRSRHTSMARLSSLCASAEAHDHRVGFRPPRGTPDRARTTHETSG